MFIDDKAWPDSIGANGVFHAALAIHEIISNHNKVHFWEDTDAQNQAINDIDDYLYDELKGKRGIELTVDEMDKIIKRCMDLAKHRSGR